MPLGLKQQIICAISIIIAALALPTALSASGDGALAQGEIVSASGGSAGSISTSTRVFLADDFPASAYADWDGRGALVASNRP